MQNRAGRAVCGRGRTGTSLDKSRWLWRAACRATEAAPRRGPRPSARIRLRPRSRQPQCGGKSHKQQHRHHHRQPHRLGAPTRCLGRSGWCGRRRCVHGRGSGAWRRCHDRRCRKVGCSRQRCQGPVGNGRAAGGVPRVVDRGCRWLHSDHRPRQRSPSRWVAGHLLLWRDDTGVRRRSRHRGGRPGRESRGGWIHRRELTGEAVPGRRCRGRRNPWCTRWSQRSAHR